MQLLQKLLNRFNGLHYPQEYLCLAKGPFEQPLHVYLVTDKRIIKDITILHLFVGYCPLVFALADTTLPQTIHLIFSHRVLNPNESFKRKDALASLDLRLVKKQAAGDGGISYYEGTNGVHHFLSAFHRFINSICNNLYNKKQGNVFLHNNLYKQVQIAYAVPRNISLITIHDNGSFNLFPTDLHGQVDKQHYIISLRTEGKAAQQVETAGKLLITQVHADMYKTVYALGKNHMQPLKTKDNFPFGQSTSAGFQWPLPEHAISYKELILLDSFNHGIHKIFLFKIVLQQQFDGRKATLSHIHNSYATWRYKNGLAGNYLLR
jgi:hypothetical protein